MKVSVISKEWLIALAIFFQLYLPSIKLVWSSSLLNLVSLLALIVMVLFKEKKLDIPKARLLYVWYFFAIILITSFFFENAIIGPEVFKVLYMLFVVVLVIFLTNSSVTEKLIFIILCWASLISVWQLLLGITASHSLGQTYLTIALPIGSGLTISLVCLFLSKSNFTLRFRYLILSVLFVSALGTLLSRAALGFPFLILIIIFILFFIFSRSMSKAKKIIVFILGVVSIFLLFTNIGNILNERQIKRIERLADIENEPRYIVYQRAINLVFDNPILGYGGGAPAKFFNGTYPHNMFLDILINGGILLLIPFIIILSLFFRNIFFAISKLERDPKTLSSISMSMFFFFQWNISFGLDTLYIPVSALIICFYYIEGKRH